MEFRNISLVFIFISQVRFFILHNISDQAIVKAELNFFTKITQRQFIYLLIIQIRDLKFFLIS